MFKNKKAKTIITCIICGLIAFVVTYTGAFERLDKRMEDILYHHPQKVDANIKIIKIVAPV